jgi:hypothetical protein
MLTYNTLHFSLDFSFSYGNSKLLVLMFKTFIKMNSNAGVLLWYREFNKCVHTANKTAETRTEFSDIVVEYTCFEFWMFVVKIKTEWSVILC